MELLDGEMKHTMDPIYGIRSFSSSLIMSFNCSIIPSYSFSFRTSQLSGWVDTSLRLTMVSIPETLLTEHY